APESREALRQVFENRGVPNERGGRGKCLGHGTMTRLGAANLADHLAGRVEPENNFGAVLANLTDFGAAGDEQYDVADGIAFEVNCLAPSEIFLMSCRDDLSALFEGDVKEQREILNQRRPAESRSFGGGFCQARAWHGTETEGR